MRRHRTKDPAVRIESIVNRLTEEEWRKCYLRGEATCWFQIWVDLYRQIIKEYFEGELNDNVEPESRESYASQTYESGILEIGL